MSFGEEVQREMDEAAAGVGEDDAEGSCEEREEIMIMKAIAAMTTALSMTRILNSRTMMVVAMTKMTSTVLLTRKTTKMMTTKMMTMMTTQTRMTMVSSMLRLMTM